MNERKTKGLTNLNSDEKKSLGKLVCPWPECIFRSLLQFLVTLDILTVAPLFILRCLAQSCLFEGIMDFTFVFSRGILRGLHARRASYRHLATPPLLTL